MKSLSFFIFCILLTFASCKKTDIASGVPGCIAKEINDNRKDPNWMIGSVSEYQFQGRIVYSFVPDTRRVADASSAIIDSDCNTLCHVGGFGGPAINQCNGENFFQSAVFKRTIWAKK